MAKSRAARGRVNGKEESGQKLQLRQFLQALEMIASATGVSTDQLLCKVVVYDKISTIPEPNNSMSPEEWCVPVRPPAGATQPAARTQRASPPASHLTRPSCRHFPKALGSR